jgi:hypothetical protein
MVVACRPEDSKSKPRKLTNLRLINGTITMTDHQVGKHFKTEWLDAQEKPWLVLRQKLRPTQPCSRPGRAGTMYECPRGKSAKL